MKITSFSPELETDYSVLKGEELFVEPPINEMQLDLNEELATLDPSQQTNNREPLLEPSVPFSTVAVANEVLDNIEDQAEDVSIMTALPLHAPLESTQDLCMLSEGNEAEEPIQCGDSENLTVDNQNSHFPSLHLTYEPTMNVSLALDHEIPSTEPEVEPGVAADEETPKQIVEEEDLLIAELESS